MDVGELALSWIYRGVPCDEEVTTTPERRSLRRDKSKGGEAERKKGAETGFDWPAITSRYSTRESVVVTASTCVSEPVGHRAPTFSTD